MQFTPYALAYLAAGSMSLGTALYIWPHRKARGAWPLLIALVAEVLWAWAAAGAVSVTSLEGQTWFLRVSFIGIVALPPASFAFALAYSGREHWLAQRGMLLLIGLPLITLILTMTTESHGLMFAHIGLDRSAGFARLVTVRGPWFWVHTVFSYTLLVVASLLVVLTVFESSSPYRIQVVPLFLGMFIPLIGNVIQVTHWNPLPVDLTPLAFSLGSSAIGLSLFRYHLLDLMPVARSVVIEGLADAVLVLDAQNRVVDANAVALRILGRSSSAVMGLPAAEVLSAYPELMQHYRDVTEGEAEVPLQLGGERRHYALRFSPIAGFSGTNIGRVIVARDITERVHLIEELDAYSHAVAHDLKNPIAIISGYARLLQENMEAEHDEKNRELIEATLRGCDRMTRIVNELLTLSHVRHTDSVPVVALDMNAIVAEVTDRLRNTIRDSGAQIAIPAQWPSAQGYSAWIEEVWTNYISNAIKYGGAPPQLQLGAEQSGYGMVRFWVRDNGAGIAPQDQERLFREFSRLHPTRNDSHGLGLSIVKRIVEKLGGQVGVDSVVGAGSTFWFTLPAASPLPAVT